MRSALLIGAVVLEAGCRSMTSPAGQSATANLQPTKGNSTSGTATFTQTGDRVRVVADVSGLNPGQEHGFHIHEAADCSSGDGMSTKGHYNPLSKPHAHYSAPERHAGDMPALKADVNGLIVHAGSDDYKTQPAGNAGARVACGIIQRTS